MQPQQHARNGLRPGLNQNAGRGRHTKRGDRMERRSFIKHAGIAGILAAGSAPVFAQTAPEVKWRLASSFPKSLDTIYGAAEVISKRVAAATNNKFQIQTFAGGEIVPAFGVVDAVQNATIQCAHTAPYSFFGTAQ